MIAPDLETGIARLRELVEQAAVVVPFTGAGISTECGIPDFRSPGGIWTKMQPIEFGDFLASQEMRDESWRRRFAMEEQFGGAKPGRGHRALASLYKAGKIPGIITQNIDNLHQDLGVCRRSTWSSCTATRPMRPASTAPNATNCPGCSERFTTSGGRSPDCPDCDGYIKTATVSFGQSMPEAAMRRAQELTESCDLFLAIGSSLVVWPAAGFPLAAKRNGARLVIINRDATEFDEIADLVLHDDIGAVLAPFIAH